MNKDSNMVFIGDAVMTQPSGSHNLLFGEAAMIATSKGTHMYYFMGRSSYGNDIYYRADYVDPYLLGLLKKNKASAEMQLSSELEKE